MTCFRYCFLNDFGLILKQKVDHFDKLLLAGKQATGKGCMCKNHCKTQVISRFLHKRQRIICYYRIVFRSKKLCLLLRRVQWQFGRLQGASGEGSWACLWRQNWIKHQCNFLVNFYVFFEAPLEGPRHSADLAPPPSNRVLDHFWSRIDKIPCVFVYFAKR